MSSWEIFLNWFKEYYSHEYLDLEQEVKDYWIEEILLNNSKYIDKLEEIELKYSELNTKLAVFRDENGKKITGSNRIKPKQKILICGLTCFLF